MTGIVLAGTEAVDERKLLLADGREVIVAIRERDAHGKKKTAWMQLGCCPSTAWVFYRVEAEGMEPRVILEEVLAHEAAELFGACIERLQLRRCLVDPSPLSAQFVEISPDLGDVVTDLRNAFGVELNTWW